MKLSLLALITLLSTSAFAGERHLCHEIDAQNTPKMMILTQLSNDLSPYKLEIFDSNTGKRIYLESVNVRTEDEMSKFTNSAQKIRGMIFMDEPEQSWLQIGQTTIKFNCK